MAKYDDHLKSNCISVVKTEIVALQLYISLPQCSRYALQASLWADSLFACGSFIALAALTIRTYTKNFYLIVTILS